MIRILTFTVPVGLTVVLAAGWQNITASATPCVNPAGPTQTTAPTSRTPSNAGALLPQPKGPFPPGIAPQSVRVDLVKPSFSNPTAITHPLFPVAKVAKTLLLGKVGGLPLHVEYTLLPGTRTIRWNGQAIKTLEVQYAAHLGGRVEELALDWYAQADDGSVWYFGKAVFNYQNGVVADTKGTWLAGRDGMPAMIMPARPQVGNVYRVENIPGVVFEEITVKAVDVTVRGPNGPVTGAMIARQLHMDGTYSNKTFAPAYGEFVTITDTDLEALALALPIDALDCTVPAELEALSGGARAIFEAVPSGAWKDAATRLEAMVAAWDRFQAGDVPALLETQMSDALNVLAAAVNARQSAEARQASISVAQAGLDLELRYRPLHEVELARSELWTRQLLLDTAAKDRGAVRGDVTTLEWLWKRVGHTLEASKAPEATAQLAGLRRAANAGDFAATLKAIALFRKLLVGIGVQ